MPAFAVYKAYVDWDGDGDFSETIEEITSYVLGWQWTLGKESSSRLARGVAGSCQLELDNSTSIFSKYSSGALTGLIRPGLLVRITMTIGAGSEITMWQGDLDTIIAHPGPSLAGATATLVARGILTRFTESKKVQIGMQTDTLSGTAFGLVLDAVGFPAGSRQIDAGESTFGRYWTDGKSSAIKALWEIADTEAGDILETKDGKIAFEDRNHRAGHSVAATYTNDPAGTIRYSTIDFEGDERRDICNVVEAEVRTFDKSEDVVLWALGGNPPLIQPQATIIRDATFPNPSTPAEYIAVSAWSTIDYEANSAADGSGTDLTANVSIVQDIYAGRQRFTITNNSYSDAAYLIVLRAHGVAVVESDPIIVSARDQDSIDNFEERGFPRTPRFLTDQVEGQDYCDHWLALLKDPYQGIQMELEANANADHLAEAQALDISRRIHVHADSRSGLFIDDDHFVERITHNITQNIHRVQILASPLTSHSWAASGTAYTPKIIIPESAPDDLYVNAIPSGLDLLFGVMALKQNKSIYEAEFRAKYFATENPESVDLRTVGEGGTLAHDGTTELVITGLGANYNGCQYLHTSAAQGRWYFAWRLKSSTVRGGWSVWSDGNAFPQYVKDWVETEDSSQVDTGPPADWTLAPVTPGPVAGTVIVSAPRPSTNGKKILDVIWQIKDSSSGSWRAIDADAGAADTIYDGSAVDHEYNKATGVISKTSGNYGVAAPGDLILFDVRDSTVGGWSWDKQECQWGTVVAVNGTSLTGLFGFRPMFAPTAGVYPGVRIKIVKPPQNWTTEGYLGAEANRGLCQREYWSQATIASFARSFGQRGDTTTMLFVSDPIQLPSGLAIENVQARVWFGNMRSRSDDDTYSASPPSTASTGYCVILTDAATILTDARLAGQYHEKLFVVSITDNRTLGNPTDAVCGQRLKWRIINGTGGDLELTLDTKFRNGKAFVIPGTPDTGFDIAVSPLTIHANSQAYLEAIYDAVQDKLDILAFTYDYMNSSILDDILLYFKFDETTGTREDSAENQDWTPDGSATYAAGKVGNAGKLTTSGDMFYGSSSSPSLLADWSFPTTGYTCAFWAKVDSIDSDNAVLFLALGQVRYDISFQYYDPWRWYGGDPPQAPGFYYKVEALPDYNTSHELSFLNTDGLWHFFVLWWDPATNTMNMRVDNGTPQSLSTAGALYHTPGNSYDGGVYSYETGNSYLDECGLWGRVLTEAEQEYLWNGGAGRTLY